MNPIAAGFITLCILLISGSAGLLLVFSLSFAIAEAAAVAMGVLVVLVTVHFQVLRQRDRQMQMARYEDLADQMSEMLDEMTSFRLRLEEVERSVGEKAKLIADARAKSHMRPLLSEQEILGELVQQVAEAATGLDDRVSRLEERWRSQDPSQPPRDQAQPLPPGAQPQLALPQLALPQDLEKAQLTNPQAHSGQEPPGDETPADETPADETLASALPPPVTPSATSAVTPSATPSASHQNQEPGATEGSEAARQLDPRPDRSLDAAAPEREADVEAGEAVESPDPDEPGAGLSANQLRAHIRDNHLTLYLQAIMSLPERRIRFYEAFARFDTATRSLAAADFIGPATRFGLVPAIDNIMVYRAADLVRRLRERTPDIGVFCNLSPVSLADARFFEGLITFLDDHRDLKDSLFFEFAQKDFDGFSPLDEGNCEALRDLGFGFSVDQVTDLQADFRQYGRKGVRFIKTSAAVLLSALAKKKADIHPADLDPLLQRFGIDLIVDRIESEAQNVELLDYSARYGQGFLLAPAKPIRTDPTYARRGIVDSRRKAAQ